MHKIYSILLIIVFLLVFSGTLLGVITPITAPVYSVGIMQFGAFPTGLALFQNTQGRYFAFSPFNDFVVSTENLRTALITEAQISNHEYQSSFPFSKPQAIIESIKNYLGITYPEITFTTDQMHATFSSRIQGNNLTISKTITFIKPVSVKTLGSTISFDSEDFIYDTYGNLYNYVPENLINTFTQTYGKKLSPKLDEIEIMVPDKAIFIYSPRVAGVIKVMALKNQTVTVNRNTKLIEVREVAASNKQKYESFLRIQIFETPKEAK